MAGIFGIDSSKTSTKASTYGASEYGQIVTSKGVLVNPGGVNLANALVGTYSKANFGTGNTITISDMGATARLAEDVTASIGGLANNLALSINDLVTKTGAITSDALKQVSDRADTQDTQGQSLVVKNFVWLLAIASAAIVFGIYAFKSKTK